jgi:hypothetical protein
VSASPRATRFARLAFILAVALCAACGGHEATRFVGSAMDDAAADSSARLTLVLWPSSDSMFVGHLRVDAPLGIEGAASAWHGKEGFTIYNISTDGDTTVWKSRFDGTEIGGVFEVTGGGHSGQGGTWRARLAEGPPPTRQTLQRYARLKWIPPFHAIWPGIVVAVLLVLTVRWVRSAPEITIDPRIDAFEDHRLWGWLALFSAGQCVNIVFMIVHSAGFLDVVKDGGWSSGAAIPGLHGLLVVEKTAFLVRLSAPVVGLYLIAKRSRFAPRFWFAYMASLGVYAAFDLASGAWIEASVDDLLNPAGRFDARRASTHEANLRLVLTAILWSCYWARSTRVRARFGQRALDEPAPSVPLVAPVPGD